MLNDPKYKKYLEYITLGGEIAVAFTAPILVGFWMDSSFNTTPWALLSGILLGLCLMLIIFLRIIRDMKNSD